MNKIILSIAALCAFVFVGCVSTTNPKPVVAPNVATFVSNIAEPTIQGAVPIILDKNPGYAGALGLLADAIPAAFGSGNLTPDNIGSTLALLNDKAKLGLTPDVQGLVANAISIIVVQYQQQMGTKVTAATDPGVAQILNAVASGLHNGVVAWQQTHKA